MQDTESVENEKLFLTNIYIYDIILKIKNTEPMIGGRKMKFVFSKANVFSGGTIGKGDYSFNIDSAHEIPAANYGGTVFDCSEYFIFPGFTDVHVHFREPGFLYKENTKTGSLAAAHGGYTTVCTMPNLNPTPDSVENLNVQLEAIKSGAKIRVLPFGSITKGEAGKELSDIEALAPYVCGYSDDGRGVDDTGLMREAMQRAKALGKVISAHCEDGSCIKDSPEAEWKQIERDIRLADEVGCKYHVCHISTKESVALIRDAKKSGVDITCETAPHYLLLTDADKCDSGRFRMNPPLRDEADKLALIEGVVDGTVDMIATDHAPHSAEEKGRGFEKSLNGIVGLETAFPVLYTGLVKKAIITLERLVTMMSDAPNKRFGLECGGFNVYDLNAEYKIDPNEFMTMGRSTPFEGNTVFGKCLMTVCDGKTAWLDTTFGNKITLI